MQRMLGIPAVEEKVGVWYHKINMKRVRRGVSMQYPHNISDSSFGLLVVLLAVAGGLICLYNAWRMGRLPWKPKGPPNPYLVCIVISVGFVLVMALAVLVN